MATEYRLRIRNRENTADAIVITSVRGDAKPYIKAPPTGEGYQFDPRDGRSRAGTMTVEVLDAVHAYDGAMPLRVITQELEDETARWALPARRAFLDQRDGGGDWKTFHPGVISQHSLQGGLTWTFAVTDIALVTQKVSAFAPRRHPDPALAAQGKLEPIADYLARWPKRGCLLGGPVRGGLLGMPDFGGWRMTVQERKTNPAANAYQSVWLKFVEGYGAPGFRWTKQAGDVWQAIEDEVGRSAERKWGQGSITTCDEADVESTWPGMVLEIQRAGTTSYFRPGWSAFFPREAAVDEFFNGGTRRPGLWVGASNAELPLGSQVRVRAFDLLPSERNPIYWTGHPVDLIAQLLDETDETYLAPSLETVRQAIGARRYLTIRMTEMPDRQTFLENVIYGPFGIAMRPHSSGAIEYFTTRIFANAAPTVELTAAKVPQEDGGGFTGTTFDVDTTTAISQVVLEHDRLKPAQLIPESERAQLGTPPLDGVYVDAKYRIERKNGDPGAVPGDTVEFTIPGMLHPADANTPDTEGFFDVVALEMFDRWGRGAQESEHEVKLGTDVASAALGDEILNALPQFPNHNRRLGDDPSVSARAQQITQRSVLPSGVLLRLLDSGANAQPIPIRPVLAIAASSSAPRTVAEVTITDAATLNAAGYGVQLLMAATVAAPTDGDYTPVRAFAPGQVPTGAIALPAVFAGRTVYAVARSTHPQFRPSNRSEVVSLVLAGVDPVTGLSATPDPANGSRAVLAWALPDDAPFVLDVTVRRSSEAVNEARRLPVLPPESTGAALEELAIGAEYVATVTRRDPATGDVSATASITFTAGAAQPALEPPMIPTGFTGFGGLRCGLAVLATEFPSFIAFRVRTETPEGSGIYGDYEDLGRVESLSRDWTVTAVVTPYDRRRRAFSARTEVDGLMPSDWTADVIVSPWIPTPLPPLPQLLDSVYGLSDVRVERIDGTTAQVSWARGSQVVYVFAYQWTVQAGTEFPVVTSGDEVKILRAGTDVFTLTAPGVGQRTYYQLEARDAEFRLLSDVIRDAIDPIPIPARWRVETSAPADGVGRVTVHLVDAGGFVDPTLRVRFRKTIRGELTDHAPATAPSGSATSGTYTFDVTEDPKHSTRVEPYVTYTDGSIDTVGAFGFDRDKHANIEQLSHVVEGNLARVLALFDTDTVPGTGTARYQFDSEADSGWTLFDVGEDLTGVIPNIPISSLRTVVYVQGKNAAGQWGPSASIELPAYGMALSAKLTQLTATHGVITWAGVGVEVAIGTSDTYGPPPPDDDGVVEGNQITIERNPAGGAAKLYHFRSRVNGQFVEVTVTIPAQENTPATNPLIWGVSLNEHEHSPGVWDLQVGFAQRGAIVYTRVTWWFSWPDNEEPTVLAAGVNEFDLYPTYTIDPATGTEQATVNVYVTGYDADDTHLVESRTVSRVVKVNP